MFVPEVAPMDLLFYLHFSACYNNHARSGMHCSYMYVKLLWPTMMVSDLFYCILKFYVCACARVCVYCLPVLETVFDKVVTLIHLK